MHEEGRTWEVTSLFRKLKVPRFPPCPLMRRGWLCLLATLDAKKELGAVPGTREIAGRGAGGSAPRTAIWRRGGLTTPKQSFPEKAPAPSAQGAFFPLTARVSGCTGQDGL